MSRRKAEGTQGAPRAEEPAIHHKAAAPAELLSDLAGVLRAMADDYLPIGDFARLLAGVTRDDKAIEREHVPGILRALGEIVGHADAIGKRHEEATTILHCLRQKGAGA